MNAAFTGATSRRDVYALDQRITLYYYHYDHKL